MFLKWEIAMTNKEFYNKHKGKRVRVVNNLSSNGLIGAIIAFDDERDIIVGFDKGVVYDNVPLESRFRKDFIEEVDNIEIFLGCDFEYVSQDQLVVLTTNYPNTQIFKILYPNGREENGFWRVN